MAYKGARMFFLQSSEIEEYLMADTSDCEDALVLDEEDQVFIEQDMAEGASEVIIEPARAPDSVPSTSSTETLPSASTVPIFKWKTNTYRPYNFLASDYEFGKINILQNSISPSPIDVFEAVTNIKVLIEDVIIPESILYAQQNGSSFTTDYNEIAAFLGMNYVMGYHVLPTLRNYWSTEPDMGVPFVANVMPLLRFEEIRKHLHFCNNETQPLPSSSDFDRAFKIRKIIDHFNCSFQEALYNTISQSVDEHMVKFKGHNIMKQYMQNKPVKRGFKLWCRADSATGYLFQFDIYTGKKRTGVEVGLGESVVLELTKPLVGLGCEVYFDNYFNSPILQYNLAKLNIKACGTVRLQRKNIPKNITVDRDMKRGDIFSTSFEGISFIKWMDNKAVHLLTNFLSPIPTQVVKRRKIGCAQRLDVTCPDIVCKYNKNMGGVDLMDQKKVTYEVDRKSKIKYYLRLFFDILDIAMNNAYIIYTKLYEEQKVEGSLLSSLEYRQIIARAMIGGFSARKNALPSTSMTKKRIQNSSSRCRKTSLPTHVMIKAEKRKRCVQCAKSHKENRTNNICEICCVHLCFTADRNCFTAFHE
ncbi:unnamed protein product [Euphydryas editha]|uniref:PiggyBac transposable element-derived protein domain-containing protein n=1 Tax=Euphydryas editha TaxID=104508 RepID=A0AAU9VD63_EUPED|nr:unnamed protein product [Euphydryas editha]